MRRPVPLYGCRAVRLVQPEKTEKSDKCKALIRMVEKNK